MSPWPPSMNSASFELLALPMASALSLPLAALAALVLDRLLGEPARWHPLVGFGALADRLEQWLRRGSGKAGRRVWGVLAWSFAVLPWVALAAFARNGSLAAWLLDVVLLYLALGGRSLVEHAARVASDLAAGDLAAAREHVGWIVSRDTSALDEGGVAKACVESALENGNDAVFGALFWFALFGGPGALLFRLANTLDAMWGYKNDRFLHFGWAAARIDDVLNYVPARLTALSYALCGGSFNDARRALACWRAQAVTWESPNAGPVMAAGAGSLGVALGGTAIYHGAREERPALGTGRPARGDDIRRVVTLLRRALLLWLAVIWLVAIFAGGLFGA